MYRVFTSGHEPYYFFAGLALYILLLIYYKKETINMNLFNTFFNKQLKEETAKQIAEQTIRESHELKAIHSFIMKKRKEHNLCRTLCCSQEVSKEYGIDYASYASGVFSELEDFYKILEDKKKNK